MRFRCRATGPAAPPARSPSSAAARVDGAPTILTANATVTFTGSDVTVAMNQTNERQRAVVEALVTAGVDRKDIAASNVTPVTQYGSDGTTVTGYQASNGFTVTVRDRAPPRGCWP